MKQKKPLQHKAAETFNRGSTLLERIKQAALLPSAEFVRSTWHH
ncbi:hypothetical protein [Paenibacillus etheri]|nr:hypothetical protein [Paenibacillus etheri]